MKRKVKIAVITSACVLSMALASATAYFSDRDQQVNKITVGINTIEIQENFEKTKKIEPGSTIVKSPKVHVVEEDGAVDCYVRMSAEWADSAAEVCAQTQYVNGETTTAINTTDWTEKQEDGYYYYKKKLSPGETTTPLFTQIVVFGTASEEEIEEVYDFDMICYAESAQAYNATGDKYYDNYSSAWAYWNEKKEGLE